jgi:hypothetical protein
MHTRRFGSIISIVGGLLFSACAGETTPIPDMNQQALGSMERIATNTNIAIATGIGQLRLKFCYPDHDGDGYGAGTVTITSGACPTGTVDNKVDCDDARSWLPESCLGDKDGDGAAAAYFTCDPWRDCNSFFLAASDIDDANSSVHPLEQGETANNGVDDNQNGWVDEIEYDYAPAGHNNTWNSVDIRLRFNRAFDAEKARTNSLRVTVEAHPLNSSYPTLSNSAPQVSFTSDSNGSFATYRVSGLYSGQVYRIQTRVTNFASAGQPVVIYPISPEPYWTMTYLAGSNEATARLKVVLAALYERDRSLRGQVQNGSGYGASNGAAWGSEFYAWLTRPILSGMDPSTHNDANDMKAFFNGRSNWHDGSTYVSAGHAAPGDYLGTDPNGQGSMSQSEMFLAYDTRTGVYYSVSGNCNNRVCTSYAQPSPRIKGVGSISNSMLRPLSGDGSYCESNRDCPISDLALSACEAHTCVTNLVSPGGSCNMYRRCGPALHCESGKCTPDRVDIPWPF